MDFIAIGRISKPIGTRGEVKVLPMTDTRERFSVLQSVWVGDGEASVEQYDIRAVRIDTRQVVLHLKGIETVEKAKGLRDKFLFVPKEKRMKLRSGSYFVDDVIGCEVFTEEKVKIGMVTDLFSLPANDVWIVRKGGKEILIPAVKAIIQQVDVIKRRIIIHAVEGLIE